MSRLGEDIEEQKKELERAREKYQRLSEVWDSDSISAFSISIAGMLVAIFKVIEMVKKIREDS